MKIKQFIEITTIADGGTISCRATLHGGTILEFGLDARTPRTKAERQIFIGASYPTLPGARILPRHGKEEQEFIAAIQAHLAQQEPSDTMARAFIDMLGKR